MKVIDLFAGAGGMSLGFEKAGFEIISAYDNWDKAVEVYKKNFNHQIIQEDLSLFDYNDLKGKQCDVIIGGPPCQDFSLAGKRDETLGRADLTVRFAEIVCGVMPNYFVMENVAQVEKSKAFQKSKQIFLDKGYGLTSVVLDASYYGVPQKRKRFFMIGVLNGEENVLKPFLEKQRSYKQMTLRDYFGDSLGVEHYYRHPRSYQRRAIFSIDEPSPTIRGVNRPMPATYVNHKGDTAQISGDIRALTSIERSYIQTFPTGYFDDTVAKTHLEQMIGNAVPVNLAMHVALALKDYIQTCE